MNEQEAMKLTGVKKKATSKYTLKLDGTNKELRKLQRESAQKTFIEWLYENNYVIVSPEEWKKISRAIGLAYVHGMWED